MGLRLTTNLTEDQRHDEWARIIRRIAEEHVGQAWSNYMFRLLRAVFNVNRRLAQSDDRPEGDFSRRVGGAQHPGAGPAVSRRLGAVDAGT